MHAFEWISPLSLSDAANAGATTVADAMLPAAAGAHAGEPVIAKAGGIDLLELMKEGLLRPRRLVNLRGLPGLAEIAFDRHGNLQIGAMCTLEQLAVHPSVRARYAALAEAAAQAASPQIRHMASLGGNLLQRPRCWYFRSTHYPCTRKGGDHCFAFGGENQYHAIFDHDHCAIVHPSTVATALVALGAKIELVGSEGSKRDVLLEDFFLLPSQDVHRENDLRPGEILTAIRLPSVSATNKSVYLKQGEKEYFDWPLADVSVALDTRTDGVCRTAVIVLGAAAPVPHRARAAEASLLGRCIDGAVAAEASRAALSGAKPLSKNRYKVPIFEALIRRAILRAAGVSQSGS